MPRKNLFQLTSPLLLVEALGHKKHSLSSDADVCVCIKRVVKPTQALDMYPSHADQHPQCQRFIMRCHAPNSTPLWLAGAPGPTLGQVTHQHCTLSATTILSYFLFLFRLQQQERQNFFHSLIAAP